MTTRSRTLRRESEKRHVLPMAIISAIGIIFGILAISAVSMFAVASSWLDDLPDYKDADAYAAAEPTQVYDARGNVIASFYLQNRRSVKLADISEYVVKATVDTEDVRFYEHNGIDTQSILRAVVFSVTGRGGGASTITQQLVRNTVLSDEQFEHSMKRKVREAYIAMQIEKTFSKDQILEMYLNTIYYGHDAYGIEAAAITYFDKHASELTLSEAALLSGLPQSPSYYDPYSNMESAISRRNVVIERMVAAGDLTQEEADAVIQEGVELHQGSLGNDPIGTYPFITDYIREELLKNYDMSTIFQGGLRVYTTIDPDQQRAAEEAVATVMDDIGDDELDATIVAIDPSNGHLLAMVGGRDYEKSQFNLATQAKRQVGSSFKSFTLAAALDKGVDPQVIIDCSSAYRVTSSWTVHNVDHINMGDITFARATEESSNTGYVQVEEEIGIDCVQDVAQKLGIPKASLPDDLTLTLGTGGVPALYMANAYAGFADGGKHHDIVSITRIENGNGTALFVAEDKPTEAMTPEVAHATTKVLEGVVTNGTATTVLDMTRGIVDQPIAGKTGTTEDARDLWFCGYTPQVACAVWVGYHEEKLVYVHGDQGHPYNTACPIFAEFLNRTLEGVDREEFPVAEDPKYKNVDVWNFSKGRALSAEEQAAKDAEERQRQEEEEAKKKAEEEAKKKQEQAEADAQKAAEAARKKAEKDAEEAAKKAEEEAKKQAEKESEKTPDPDPEPDSEPTPDPTPQPEPTSDDGGGGTAGTESTTA